mgnify:CR=1 FL=1
MNARRDGWSRPLPLGRSPTEEFILFVKLKFLARTLVILKQDAYFCKHLQMTTYIGIRNL